LRGRRATRGDAGAPGLSHPVRGGPGRRDHWGVRGLPRDQGLGRVHEAYPGATWDRLVEVKDRYDPTNLLRHNQNIPPSTLAPAARAPCAHDLRSPMPLNNSSPRSHAQGWRNCRLHRRATPTPADTDDEPTDRKEAQEGPVSPELRCTNGPTIILYPIFDAADGSSHSSPLERLATCNFNTPQVHNTSRQVIQRCSRVHQDRV
jgi:Berberine and berberine like